MNQRTKNFFFFVEPVRPGTHEPSNQNSDIPATPDQTSHSVNAKDGRHACNRSFIYFGLTSSGFRHSCAKLNASLLSFIALKFTGCAATHRVYPRRRVSGTIGNRENLISLAIIYHTHIILIQSPSLLCVCVRSLLTR